MEQTKFSVKFCPNCGKENTMSDAENCAGCGKAIEFTIDEFNTLDKGYCINCGHQLTIEKEVCNYCGEKFIIDLSQESLEVMASAHELRNQGKKREAIEEAKKLLASNIPPGKMYYAFELIALILLQIQMDKYGNLNYFPKEFVQSKDFMDILEYSKRALKAYEESSPEHKRNILDSSYFQRIKQIVQTFSQEFEKVKSGQNGDNSKKSGCFIATSVYGDKDNINVVILKSFRDKVLLSSLIGKLLVRVYYSISPSIARFISDKIIMRKILKNYIINPLVIIIKRIDL